MNKWWNSYTAIPNKVDCDGLGADYSNLDDTTSSGLVYYVNEFCYNVPLSQYPKILDIGAGNGGETRLLTDKGYSVIGITMGIDNVKMAKELYDIDLLNTDMNHLDFEINSFDAVMMIQTFEHFLSSFIATIELWRVLRINGLCYLDVPCPLDKEMWNINHTNLLYADQLINMFSMCGFELVKQLSNKNEHRIRLIFKKLSISKIRNWEQLRYIHQLRNKV
jgi:SAM-dependent methyltransferase